MSANSALVVHVLPCDMARGAQVYARALRDHLDSPARRHRTWAIFDAPAGGLMPDRTLISPPPGRRVVSLRVLLSIRRALREEQPDLVVAHGSESLKYMALACPGSIPLVYYRIGVGHAGLHRFRSRIFHRWLLRRANLVAGVSQETLREATSLLAVPETKTVLIPNGRDPGKYLGRRVGDDRSADSPVRLVFVGRLVDTKRPDLFVEVVRDMLDRGLACEARIVGDGPLRRSLEALATEVGVAVVGTQDDVAGLLANSDVLVFTSVPEGEGMPGILIEAGLAGLPAVSTQVPGAATVIIDGSTGFVVPHEDRIALADAVARLVKDPALRFEMGRRAREHCVTNLSMDASARRWQEVLDSLLGSDGRPGMARA